MSDARHATARWLCHPPEGAGHLHSQSRAFEGLPFSLPDGEPESETTPAELLAAAYAAFLSAYVAQALDADGVPARELVVDVACRLSPQSQVPRAVEGLEVEVRGRVDDVDDSEFDEAVHAAWQTCTSALGLRADLPLELRIELVPATRAA
jgi:organic hydroperoxide reductase OsmC/OhrA